MHRKHFIRTCSWAMAGMAGGLVFHSCAAGKKIHAEISDGMLLVRRDSLPALKYPKALVIHRPELEFPVCLFQHAPERFSALWLRCTHQGVELQLFGDRLICPAHGSEFNSSGEVTAGPAPGPLRTFTVEQDAIFVKVLLR